MMSKSPRFVRPVPAASSFSLADGGRCFPRPSAVVRRCAGMRQRFARQARAVALTLGVSAWLLGGSARANTELDVPNDGNTYDLSTLQTASGSSDLTTSDVTFINPQGGYAVGTIFNASSNLDLGTLNDLDSADGQLSLSSGGPDNTTITIHGGSNSVAAANGGSASDLLFTAAGATLNVSNNLALAPNVTTGSFDTAGAFVLAGTLSGGSSTSVFTKTGAGNFELDSGVNTLAASNVQVNAGTFTLGGAGSAGGALSNVPLITVNSGGTLALTSSDVLGYTTGKEVLVINSGGAVLSNGSGSSSPRVTLENTVTITGGTLGGSSIGDYYHGAFSFNVANSGGLRATSDASGNAAMLSAVTALQSNTTFNVTRGSAAATAGTPDLIVGGIIYAFNDSTTGSSLTFTGNGVTEFDAANRYTGTTYLNAGTLQLGGANSATGSLQYSTLNLNGGTLAFGKALTSTAIGTLTGSVGNISLTNGNGTGITLGLGGGTYTTYSGTNSVNYNLAYGNVFSGLGSITKTGTGILTLSGANTYTGATTASGGTLDLANALAIQNSILTPSGGTVTFDAAVTGNAFTVAGLAGSGALALQNNATTPAAIALSLTGAGSTTYGGVLSGAGSLLKTGTAVLAISGSSNTYTGGTTISGGTVSVLSYPQQGVVTGGNGAYYSQNAALGTGLVTLNTGGSLLFNPGSNLSNQFYSNSFNLNGGTINAYDAETRLGGTVTTSGGTVTSYGAAAGSTINVTSNGGVFATNFGGKDLYVDGQLTGSGALRVDSFTTGSGGTVHLDNGTDTYSGTLTVASASTGFGGGALEIDNGTALQNATLSVNSARGASFGSGVTSATIGALGGTSTSGLALPSGTLTLGGNNASTSFAGVLSGTGSLVKTGTGNFTLTGANTYTGATTISAGTLQLGDGSTKSGSLASGSIVDNSTLAFADITNQSYGGVISGTGTVTVTNPTGAQAVLTGANTYTGTTIINAGTYQLGANGTTGSLSPSSTIVDNGLFILYRGNAVVQGTDFSSAPITGTGGLVQGGNGTATLNAANTYTGTTTAEGSGTLILANRYAIQNSTLNATGAVQFDQSVAANAFTLGGLSGSTNLALANNATTPSAIALTLGNNGQAATYGGTLTGAGSLIKVGTGNQTLSASSTYTGTTTINGGTLTLGGGNGAAGALGGTPSITVNNGATLVLTNSDTLGYTTGKEVLFINDGAVLNNAPGYRDTIQNTITMVGGTLGGSSPSTSGAYSFDISGGGLTATSDSSGNAATINAPSISLQTTSTTFNVTRGSAAPAVDANVSSAIINYNSNVFGLTKTGNGILQLSGANTFTGGLYEKAGTVLLTGSLASQTLALGGNGNGATFNYAPATSGSTETLSSLNLVGGANTVSASTGNTLALGGISRNGVGMTVNFNPASTGTITTTTANDATGIISTYASYGSGTNLSYATASGTASPYTVAAYTAGTTYSGTNSSTVNYNFASSVAAASTAGTVNSLRYTGTAGGTLTVPAGSKLTLAGLMNAGSGTLTINGPTVTGTTSNQGIGAGNGGVSDLTVFGNTQPIVFNASIVDNYYGSSYNSSSATFNTAGTVTLNAINTFRGLTSVLSGTVVANTANTLATTSGVAVASGGTFSVAVSNALATPGATTSTTVSSPASVSGQVALSLNGGTLLRNGTGVSLGSQSGTSGTVGLGTLTLTAASTIDFGTTGVGTLNFNGIAGLSTTNKLSVIDYTRATANTIATGTDGADDRLIFNADPTSFLSYITIDGAAPSEIALGNGEFEVTAAVPEPATWLAGALCVGAGVGAYSRRRCREA